MEGKQRRVCGVIPGRAYRTPKLNRFGYITLTEKQDTGLGEIPAHEFHYFDSTDCGEDFHAAKPASKRGWDCIHDQGRLMAGFPHLYYYGNPRVPARFLKNALEYKTERRQKKDAEIESSCTGHRICAGSSDRRSQMALSSDLRHRQSDCSAGKGDPEDFSEKSRR